MLIHHFLRQEALKMGLSESVLIQPAAMQCLLDYSWPGNVRELQNAIARSLILSENGCITVADLPQNIRASGHDNDEALGDSPSTLKQQLRHYEQSIIKSAIDAANGDRKLAADRLGIGVSSLYRKLDYKADS